MANTNDMNTPTKVPCGGFVLGEGLALSKDGKTLNVTGGGSQADWNQNNIAAADYIKNRPFYGKPLVSVKLQVYDGELYKVSDSVPTGDHSVGASCIFVNGLSGEKRESVVDGSTDDYYWAADGYIFVALKDNVTVPEVGITLPEKGTYFLSAANSFISGFALGSNVDPEITWDGSTEEIKTLDEKFLPPVSGLIVKSSTSNSTKKFKITVDDIGTITATEVTT